MDSSDIVKKQIVEMAQARFSRYGFGKTGVAEIAKDCGMSAANLYRYFESKEAIGAEIANLCLCTKEAHLREVLRRPGLSASQRLEAFLVENLRYVHRLLSDQPHLSELVEFISKERADLFERHKEVQRSLLAEILAEGNRTGDFDVPDIVHTAGTIQTMTIKFYFPPLLQLEAKPIGLQEEEVRDATALLIRGLARR